MNLKSRFFTLILNICVIAMLSANTGKDSLCFSKCNSSKKASLFLFTVGYRIPVNKNIIINSGHGVYIEGGINPGRLISKNLVLGLYAGWAFMDRSWSTAFNQNFANDFSASINKEQNFSGLDSSVIYSSADVIKNTKGKSVTMPGCEMRSFHNYSLYYGLVLSLPYKYIPIIKLYTGTTRTHFQGNGDITERKKDYNIFELRRVMYGCELVVFKGLNSLFCSKSGKHMSNKNAGALSLYYESCNFSNSSLYFDDGTSDTNISLKRFTSSSFLNKYKKEVSWGFKLSFYIM